MPATWLAEEFHRAHAKTVGDLMTRDIVSASPSLPLSEVAALLERHRIKRIPILDGDKLLGIVRANIIQALASRQPEAEKHGRKLARVGKEAAGGKMPFFPRHDR